MLIKNQPLRKPGNYLGLIFCENKKSNRILREMEGPNHTEFSAEHISKDTDVTTYNNKPLDSKIGSTILNSLKNFLNRIAREHHNNAYDNSNLSISKTDIMFKSKLGLNQDDSNQSNNESSIQEIIKTSETEKKTRINFEKDRRKLKLMIRL